MSFPPTVGTPGFSPGVPFFSHLHIMATELEAVNEMLRAVGQTPVTSITATSPRQVLLAQAEFAAVVKRIQTSGWHWNTLRTISPAPDGSSNINVPSTYLSVDMDPYGSDRCLDVIKVGTLLFDRGNDTDEFSGTLEILAVVERDLADIPDAFYEWMVAEASRRFHASSHGDPKRDRELRADEQVARGAARREEMRTRDANRLHNSRAIRRNTFKFPNY